MEVARYQTKELSALVFFYFQPKQTMEFCIIDEKGFIAQGLDEANTLRVWGWIIGVSFYTTEEIQYFEKNFRAPSGTARLVRMKTLAKFPK